MVNNFFTKQMVNPVSRCTKMECKLIFQEQENEEVLFTMVTQLYLNIVLLTTDANLFG